VITSSSNELWPDLSLPGNWDAYFITCIISISALRGVVVVNVIDVKWLPVNWIPFMESEKNSYPIFKLSWLFASLVVGGRSRSNWRHLMPCRCQQTVIYYAGGKGGKSLLSLL